MCVQNLAEVLHQLLVRVLKAFVAATSEAARDCLYVGNYPAQPVFVVSRALLDFDHLLIQCPVHHLKSLALIQPLLLVSNGLVVSSDHAEYAIEIPHLLVAKGFF